MQPSTKKIIEIKSTDENKENEISNSNNGNYLKKFYKPANMGISSNVFWQNVRKNVGLNHNECKYIIRNIQHKIQSLKYLKNGRIKGTHEQISAEFEDSIVEKLGQTRANKFWRYYNNYKPEL